MRYVTIKDIADALGISKSSVSRALAGDMRNVSPSTIERVRTKALEMGLITREGLEIAAKHILNMILRID